MVMPYGYKILVNNGSDNVLLLGGTKPLHKPNDDQSFLRPPQGNFTENAKIGWQKLSFRMKSLKIFIILSRAMS